MGYLKISNLYRDQTVLLFRRVYALEKIHGTSSHISFNPADNSISYFSGGTKYETFVSLFNETALIEAFKALTLPADKTITVYGESYGGKEQGMSLTYGKVGKFVAFDVKIDRNWLDVPDAEKIVIGLGLEFVWYSEVDASIGILDELRDCDSQQAIRNGMGSGKKMEGIIIRPIKEMTLNGDKRVISKHKREEFRETLTTRPIETDPEKLQALTDAQAIADEWMTQNRLRNALTHFQPAQLVAANFATIVKYLVNDVIQEAGSEIVESREVSKALSRKAAELIKRHFKL